MAASTTGYHFAGEPTFLSTPAQRAWLAAACAAIAASLTRSISDSIRSNHHLQPLLAGAGAYLAADLATGVFHWATDNYGRPETPLLGPLVAAFQLHHRHPLAITRRELANNLGELSPVAAAVVSAGELAVGNAGWRVFVAVWALLILFSQRFHAWAHCSRAGLPAVVVALQGAGLLVTGDMHARHHRPPYNSNYCVVSGVWNRVLDEWRVWEGMERAVFAGFGLRPRSWADKWPPAAAKGDA